MSGTMRALWLLFLILMTAGLTPWLQPPSHTSGPASPEQFIKKILDPLFKNNPFAPPAEDTDSPAKKKPSSRPAIPRVQKSNKAFRGKTPVAGEDSHLDKKAPAQAFRDQASEKQRDAGSPKNPPSPPEGKKQKKAKPDEPSSPRCTVELKIEGAIGPVTLNMLENAINRVRKENCSSLLLLINTPGGQLLTTRKIVDRILNTEFAVLCLVYPSGAHAGSAGAIILQACHVNGALEATNLGAATPVMGGGGKMSEDLRKKVVNDTSSWLDSLTSLRKRNKKFGRDIITEARAVSAEEAFKEKAIDFVGQTKMEFLQFARGRSVKVAQGLSHKVEVGDLLPLKLGFRYHVISLLTSPEFVYILFTGSLLLLYFEITHPGLGAPGLLGTIGLIISFTGMHKLSFSWAGLLLILLSLGLFLTELFVTGFGIFGFAGVVSFVVGSLMLFDPAKTGGSDIPLPLILSISCVFALLMGVVTYLAVTTLRMKKNKSGLNEEFLEGDSQAEVVRVSESGKSGLVFIQGENWRFRSEIPVKKGDTVKILSYKGLILKVQPLHKE